MQIGPATVREENGLETWARGMTQVVVDVIEEQGAKVRSIESSIRSLRSVGRRSVDPLQPPRVLAENTLWNFYLDVLQGSLAELEESLRELEGTAKDVGARVTELLAEAGNPGALVDISRALAAAAGTVDELAEAVSLSELATDDAWHGSAATLYAERASEQRDEGLDELSSRLGDLAELLEGRAVAEVEFWDSVSTMFVDAVIALTGLLVSLGGLAASIAGLVLAVPTGGVGLAVSIVGLVISAIGLIISGVGAWRMMDAWESLTDGADEQLAAYESALSSGIVDADSRWPILAV